ncbi:uncharacterized protein BJX67DRAFT_121447 [Aspergillus lucknowensis]|uniref:Protein kinase domain-containing protein n=1 Tax=Aspergillus lucknowensis TaxID=176173 RepID=A0ABR4LQE3_9EURO
MLIFHRYGRVAMSKYRTFKDADVEFSERILIIENTWSRISRQLTFLKGVWEALDEEHQDLQKHILLNFQKRLEVAVLEVSRIKLPSPYKDDSALGKRKAAKYSLLVKHSLDRAIRDLHTWAGEFDPTWWLILRIADKAIDKTIDTELAHEMRNESFEVAKHIRDALQTAQPSAKDFFLKEATLNAADRSAIPYSTSELVMLSTSGKSTNFILDSVDCSAVEDVSVFAQNVQELAGRLEKIEPTTFHLLQCLGVSRTRDAKTRKVTSFNFIFKLPKGCVQPRSLRKLLLFTTNPSLNVRLSFARQLATSVSYIHVLDFVHKNIRPETTLVFEADGSPFGPLFLLGFETFRTADGKSLRLTNADRVENMYQHPERQGIAPSTDHRMQHDIYSLGVCLLEIGLWESFVTQDNPTTPSPMFSNNSKSLKTQFTDLAKRHLPPKMGDKYTKIVVNCLTCMDPENEDFGDESEFKDEFGIKIGVKYIEKILLQLGEVSV